MGILCVLSVGALPSVAKGCPLSSLHHTSLLTGRASNSAGASRAALCWPLRCSFSVLHIRLSALLVAALCSIELQATQNLGAK